MIRLSNSGFRPYLCVEVHDSATVKSVPPLYVEATIMSVSLSSPQAISSKPKSISDPPSVSGGDTKSSLQGM